MKGEKCEMEEEVGKGNPPSEIVTEGEGGGGYTSVHDTPVWRSSL